MISKTAELVLNGMYAKKVKAGIVSNEVFSFNLVDEAKNLWSLESSDDQIKEALLKAADGSVVTLRNAMQFLKQENLIDFTISGLLSGEFDVFDLDVTSKGIKLIEGVTKNTKVQNHYENTFNVKLSLAENVNVESFVKGELGSLFSLFTA